MADISVDYVGLRLVSPVVAAPAGTTGTADLVRIAEDNGVGAVVMRTLYPYRDDDRSRPHYELIRHNLGAMRSTTLYSSEHAALWDSDRYAEELRVCKEHVQIPIIASIGCVRPAEWVANYAKLVEHAGADALELNVHCPNVVRDEGPAFVELISEALQLVKSAVKIPVIPKMTPQLENPAFAAVAIEKAGANGLVMFGRFTGLEIDIDHEEPVGQRAYAWHGGPWSIFYCLRWISSAAPLLGIPIAGCGGVASAEDVVKYLLAGASVVQSCTAIITQGYHVVKSMNQGLRDWMDRKGYKRLDDFRGRVARMDLA
ncbi:MAG: tRNA-dihydrouridine synthase [Armatimonadota bacterium]|nr:tRNA-dihydrouridine synthase [Armatimonadota bacterium]